MSIVQCPYSTPSLPLVTVVTVTFNLIKAGRQEVFKQCAESVHAQSYEAIEHLVIDGASSDGTREMLAEYEAKGWLRCISEPDTGIYDAMNRGLRHAQGKYIVFLNSDDYWHDPRGVECSVRCLEKSGAAFSYAPHTLLSEAGRFIGAAEPQMKNFICDMPIGHSTMFTCTELMRQMGGFDDANFRIIADYDFVTRLLLNGYNGVYVPCNFLSFRLGGLSTQSDYAIQRYKEYQTLYTKNYASLLGLPEGQTLSLQSLPANLLSVLGSYLHPNIYTQLCSMVQEPRTAPLLQLVPSHTCTTKWKGPLGIPVLTRRIAAQGVCTTWLVLGFLPLLTSQLRSKEGSPTVVRSYSLLGFLPVWKTKTTPGKSQKHYLFGFIPMGGVRQLG